ncbi:phage holin family protein [Niveibacterium sp.]|uniref:phage holin family protein n=1 Tax=Niveibacterium sp. TaxID=2017444 RepID=UPI0035AE66DD
MAGDEGGGIAERLGRLGDAALGTAQTRLALLAVEVEEEGLRLGTALFHLILAALFTGFGLLALAVFVTVWLWDSHRLLALGLDSVLFLGLAAWTATQAHRQLASGSRMFKDSIAELERDRNALRGRHD